jgi:hypothetical protein
MPIGDKVNELYADLSTNVTCIYNRQNLHLAIDLVFHSPLQFYFGKKLIEKGYPEALIIGDTRCGKSETAKCLLRHYRLGARSSGENTSQAGLVGGLHQVRTGWRVSWGRIPLNDKRLLVIDEVSGVLCEEIAQMSDLRSSGVAEVTKIQTERTLARTRLVWLSNPRSADSVNNFGSGTKIIENLIGKPEDIARFDFAIILEKDEIGDDEVDERKQPTVPHRHTSDLCHDLVLWAWSREAEQVRLDAATIDACYEYGKLMGKKYSSDCPIVHGMEQKIKLARLSVSLACRLFSTDDGERVIVTPEHVKYVHDFLNSQYDQPHFGYDTFSQKRTSETIIRNPKEVITLMSLWGPEFCYQILDNHQIDVKYIEHGLGLEYNEAKMHLAKLLRCGCVKKKHSFYIKTPAFITALKDFIHKPVPRPKDEF